ncbi:MAG: DNA methyltransferase [Halobacteriaceae archaeon]
MSDAKFETLKSLDWDLKDAETDKFAATIHPYHARFIPQIPERLIDTYTEPGDFVLDPFNGSGTTTMVAGTMQRHSIGVDLNPLACLIARVKCMQYDIPQLEDHIDEFLQKAKQNIRTIDSQQRLDDFTATTNTQDIPKTIPEFPDKKRWYTEDVLDQLGALFYLVNNIDNSQFRDFYRVCFSAITKKVCRSDEDWTYIGDNMYPDKDTNKLTPIDKNYDVYSHFKNRVERALGGVKDFASENPIDAEIYQTDARDLAFIQQELDFDSIDFAITSPPYPNAVDYARYHRLSFYWFGWEVTDTKEEEIGARSKRGRKNAIEDYYRESRAVYEEVYRLLRPGSHFCIVVGNTQHRNERVQAVETITEMCRDIGFTYKGELERELSRQSMSQKEINQESIIIVSKTAE